MEYIESVLTLKIKIICPADIIFTPDYKQSSKNLIKTSNDPLIDLYLKTNQNKHKKPYYFIAMKNIKVSNIFDVISSTTNIGKKTYIQIRVKL